MNNELLLKIDKILSAGPPLTVLKVAFPSSKNKSKFHIKYFTHCIHSHIALTYSLYETEQ